jgi:hypothetical protein
MPNLNRLSLTEDDPSTNIDNATSDPENGKNCFLLFLLFFKLI